MVHGRRGLNCKTQGQICNFHWPIRKDFLKSFQSGTAYSTSIHLLCMTMVVMEGEERGRRLRKGRPQPGKGWLGGGGARAHIGRARLGRRRPSSVMFRNSNNSRKIPIGRLERNELTKIFGALEKDFRAPKPFRKVQKIQERIWWFISVFKTFWDAKKYIWCTRHKCNNITFIAYVNYLNLDNHIFLLPTIENTN